VLSPAFDLFRKKARRRLPPLAVLLLPFLAHGSPIRTAYLPAGDDDNISTISPFPKPSPQTYCDWILQGLASRGFTPANGYYFTFAGSGNAADIPNIPASDLDAVVYRPWVVTNVGFKDLGGSYQQRPVVNQEAGGADFELKYTPRPNTTDPTSVNWVQAYVQNVNNAGFSTGQLDIPKRGKSPYYNAAGAAGTLKDNVAWMADIPYTCEDNGGPGCVGGIDEARTSEEVNFQTFIAGKDPVMLKDPNGELKPYIVLYGGVQWGYAYSSIDTAPEPALGILAGILALVCCAGRLCSILRHNHRVSHDGYVSEARPWAGFPMAPLHKHRTKPVESSAPLPETE
jgi:hypothetical protein